MGPLILPRIKNSFTSVQWSLDSQSKTTDGESIQAPTWPVGSSIVDGGPKFRGSVTIAKNSRKHGHGIAQALRRAAGLFIAEVNGACHSGVRAVGIHENVRIDCDQFP